VFRLSLERCPWRRKFPLATRCRKAETHLLRVIGGIACPRNRRSPRVISMNTPQGDSATAEVLEPYRPFQLQVRQAAKTGEPEVIWPRKQSDNRIAELRGVAEAKRRFLHPSRYLNPRWNDFGDFSRSGEEISGGFPLASRCMLSRSKPIWILR